MFRLLGRGYYFSKYHINNLIRLINLKLAIKKANYTYKVRGKQVYVVPITKTRFACITNDDKEFYRKQAKILGLKKFNFLDIAKSAYYKTSCGTLSKR